jgi:hypothetical protein
MLSEVASFTLYVRDWEVCRCTLEGEEKMYCSLQEQNHYSSVIESNKREEKKNKKDRNITVIITRK